MTNGREKKIEGTAQDRVRCGQYKKKLLRVGRISSSELWTEASGRSLYEGPLRRRALEAVTHSMGRFFYKNLNIITYISIAYNNLYKYLNYEYR